MYTVRTGPGRKCLIFSGSICTVRTGPGRKCLTFGGSLCTQLGLVQEGSA